MVDGTYPSQHIIQMIHNKQIKNANIGQVQPSSLDLTISDEIYAMKGIFLPQRGERVRDLLKTGVLYKTDLEKPLECEGLYLIRLNESLNLPKNVHAHTNNKSSSGRINLQTRLIADGISHFDILPNGYSGELWILISPRSFPIKLNKGDSVNQIRFFCGDPTLSTYEYLQFQKNNPVLFDRDGNPIPQIEIDGNPGGITMTVDLKSADTVGYKCSPSRVNILDFSKRNYYNADDFFEAIKRPRNGHLVLKKNEFYILITNEAIRVPHNYAVEMMAYNPSNGEFRSHYAGFFDPGWGSGPKDSLKGTPVVLEVLTNDNDFILRHSQPICKVIYERLIEPADFVYGSKKAGSHYLNQTKPRLSKHFKTV